MRLVHESAGHTQNCFITLTYDDDHLPYDQGLNKKHFQQFMKRLRKELSPQRIRFFHCGEYGGQTDRPHYHALIFGHDFSDKVLYSENNGNKLFTSAVLNRIWGYGFCTIGDVSFETAAYTARYIVKKVTGDAAEKHYQITDPLTGEIFQRQPEYITMSLKPAIGHEWWLKYSDDTFPDDSVIMRDQAIPAPKRYLKLLQMESIPWKTLFSCTEQVQKDFFIRVAASRLMHNKIRGRRVRNATSQAWNNTPQRLRVRETVKTAQVKSLKRSIEV